MRPTVLCQYYPSHFLILSKFVKINFFVKYEKLDELQKLSSGASLSDVKNVRSSFLGMNDDHK